MRKIGSKLRCHLVGPEIDDKLRCWQHLLRRRETKEGRYALKQSGHGGLRLDFVDFHSRVQPVCHAIFAQFSPAQAEFGRQWNKSNQSQENVVSNHHGHTVN